MNPENRQSWSKSSLLHGDYLGSEHHASTKDQQPSNLRWGVLLLISFFNFGNAFIYDLPSDLQVYLMKDLNITVTQFDLLYSLYSFPNIILPLFGGVIIDKIGMRVSIILFISLLILGQAVVYLGALQTNFTLMLIGRIIYGLGGENLIVSQSTIGAQWFIGKELAFSMGIILCVTKVGSSLNSFLSPKLYVWSNDNLSIPFLVGLLFCLVSLFFGIALVIVDRWAEKKGYIKKVSGDKTSLKDIKSLNRMFYLLLFTCFSLYGTFFGLTNNLNSIMVNRFGFSPETAGNFIPIVYVLSAFITPFFGIFIDYYGRRVLLMLISAAIFLANLLLIAFLKDTTPENEKNYGIIGGLVGIGIFYATYAAIFWPCVPLIVKEKILGTAYGIASALTNLMSTVIPMLVGFVHDKTEYKGTGYFWTQIMLAGLVLLGMAVTGVMYVEDLRRGGRLNRPGTSKEPSVRLQSPSSKTKISTSYAKM